MKKVYLTFLSLLLSVVSFGALAHDIDVTGVARVFLDEIYPGEYRLSVVDRQLPALLTPEELVPARCISVSNSIASYHFKCTPQLNLQDTITLPWSLEGVVLIARWSDGENASNYFRGNGNSVLIELSQLSASARSFTNLAYNYLVLGAEHILFGFDHLLFVLGLLLLLPGIWPLAKTITAFTVAHSITLGLAVLGLVSVPSAPVELIIALSIIFLAREIVMGQRGINSLVHRSPWLITFVFGLFHGLGFAGALGDIGLRSSDVPGALLFFNIGVELGQLGFILLFLAVQTIVLKRIEKWRSPLQNALAYSLGGVATYWFIERLPGLFQV